MWNNHPASKNREQQKNPKKVIPKARFYTVHIDDFLK